MAMNIQRNTEEGGAISALSWSDACAPPIEVVHAFGGCPNKVRDNICMLDSCLVAYTVGSRVAITEDDQGGPGGALTFLTTGLRVNRVSALIVSPDKRFVVVCYTALDEPRTAYATVYYMLSRPRPTRAKTLSYERSHKRQRCQSDLHYQQHEQQQSLDGYKMKPEDVTTGKAEFVTAAFSHDGKTLVLLDGGPAWILLWFEWKTGKRMFTVPLGSPVCRVAMSPLDHGKVATVGADGLFRIWRVQGDRISPLVAVDGLREGVCYRDVAWMNGDRLVVVAREGFVTLVSPSNVIQEWATHDCGSSAEESKAFACLPNGCGGSLNVVIAHDGGFLVGDDLGQLLVFEREKRRNSSVSTNRQVAGGRSDAYTCTRVLRLFDVGLVELQSGVGSSNGSLLAGAADGEIGLLDTQALFSCAIAADETDDVSSRGGLLQMTASGGGKRSNGRGVGRKVDTVAGGAPRSIAQKSPGSDGEDVVRGFAKAMDTFEDALRVAADGFGKGDGSQSVRHGETSASVSGRSRGFGALGSGSGTMLYRPVVHALCLSNQSGHRSSEKLKASCSCLTLCATKPLIAAIAKVGWGDGGGNREEDCRQSLAYHDSARVWSGEAERIGELTTTEGQGRQRPRRDGDVTTDADKSGGCIRGVEVQVWNYRTKQLLVKYPFDTKPSIVDTGATGGPATPSIHRGGSGGGGGDCAGGPTNDDTLAGGSTVGGNPSIPVDISLHPSGHSIAIAFSHNVNIFYIVGSDGVLNATDCGERVPDAMTSSCSSTSTVDLRSAPEESSSISVSSARTVSAAAHTEDESPVATLRSDHREFVTRGMFSVAGEKEPVVNDDPVSSVEYSPGGHLLAVITGKIVQILGVHSGSAGGRLGRVQTLSGHAAPVSSFSWGADDRRCWTVADGYIFEWEVGAGMGSLGTDGVRRGEFFRKDTSFEGVAADPAVNGGVVAYCVSGNDSTRGRSSRGKQPQARARKSTRSREVSNNDDRGTSCDDRRSSSAVATRGGSVVGHGIDSAALCNNDGSSGSRSGEMTAAAGRGNETGTKSCMDARKSSIMVWPESVGGAADVGLQTTVAYRLTCVRMTAFEERFKGARNALIAGTKEGMALAFDWGFLLRASRRGGQDGKVNDTRESCPAAVQDHGYGEKPFVPSGQVCLHSKPITSLVMTADGKHFFTTADDGAMFMCSIQLEGRHASTGDVTAHDNIVSGNADTKMKVAQADVNNGLSARPAAGGVSMAVEACVEEGMILMSEETVGGLQASARSALQQLAQVRHQAKFEMEKERLAQGKVLAVVEAAGQDKLSRAEDQNEAVRLALTDAKREMEEAIRGGVEQRRREASTMNAMYEKKLALQAESYIQLKAAREDAEEMQAHAETVDREHERAKREDMKKVLEDHRILKGYVDFVATQYLKAIDDEQQVHDKQVNVLRATEEISGIEKDRVKEEAKAEVTAAKKELRTLSKRMEQQCTREVDALMALSTEREKAEQLESRVIVLEEEVRAKAQRLSEWENMTHKQKTAVTELERLKKALTMQLVEQRTQLEEKDLSIVDAKEKLASHAKMQDEGVHEVSVLQKEVAAKATLSAANRAEIDRLRSALQHREAALKAAAARVMCVLDSTKEKGHWLTSKKQVEAVVVPLLDRDGMDRVEPDEVAMEQSRQRVKLQEGIHKMREALRHEHQNNEQQNLVRVAENLELTRELNLARKESSRFEAEVVRLEAKIKFDQQARLKQARCVRKSTSAPEFPSAITGGIGLTNCSSAPTEGCTMSPQVKRNQTASPGITSAVTCRHQWQDNSRRYASLVQSRQTTALSPSSLRTSGDLARKPPRVVPKTREAGGIFSCTEWLRKSGNVGRAGGSQAGMRVLLPGEGARDYSSLLKGAERLKGQVLESRVATAEAAASWLAYENRRVAAEAKRAVAAGEAEAVRAVDILSAELQKLRTRAVKTSAAKSMRADSNKIKRGAGTWSAKDEDGGLGSDDCEGWKMGGSGGERRSQEHDRPQSTVRKDTSVGNNASSLSTDGDGEGRTRGGLSSSTVVSLRLPSPSVPAATSPDSRTPISTNTPRSTLDRGSPVDDGGWQKDTLDSRGVSFSP